jgi:hypothetical protein
MLKKRGEKKRMCLMVFFFKPKNKGKSKMCAMVFSFKELKSLSKENCSSNSRVQVHL